MERLPVTCHIGGMETQEQGLSRLKAILDLIGPGASLHIDDRWMARLFGPDKKTAAQSASEFAQHNHCVFRFEPHTGGKGEGIGIFGRAHFKRDEDA
jgi:hypothetical protein